MAANLEKMTPSAEASGVTVCFFMIIFWPDLRENEINCALRPFGE